MPYSPLEGFKVGQEIGKSRKSTFARASGSLMEQFGERQKMGGELAKGMLLEKFKTGLKGDQQTGVYSFNRFSGQFEPVASVPKGSIVRNVDTEEDIRSKQRILREEGATGKQLEAGQKLGTAIKRLKIVSDQFNRALPASTNPLLQRIKGPLATLGAQSGLAPNPKLLALKSNIRPIGIQLIRAFGEVGNLSETETQSAIDTVQMANKTDEERLESVKQFAEFALGGATPEALEFMQRDPSVRDLMDTVGLKVPSSNFGGSDTDDEESIYQSLAKRRRGTT